MTGPDIAGNTDVDAIVGRLKRLLIDELQVTVPAEAISAQSSLEDELGIDSVGLVELIAAVEREFNFEFLDSDLRTSTFRNLESLAKVVAERSA